MAKLSAHIADDYTLVGLVPGEVLIGGVKVDFRTVTLAKADALCEQGCRYLKKKRKRKTKSK
jgi:hypothetical protein